jgi:hypothetical protein
MEKLIIVSGDGHIGPPVKDYEQHLDPSIATSCRNCCKRKRISGSS